MDSRKWTACAFALALASPAFAAGDVSVVVNPATRELQVTGDDADNGVEITFDGVRGSFTVTGTNATTVNGAASASVTGAKAFLLSMGAGADQATLTQTPIRGRLRVRLDDGADVLVMDGVSVRGLTSIGCGAGDDRVVAQNHCLFGNPANISGHDGNDVVEVRDSAGLRRVVIDGGAGADSVVLFNAVFNRNADVEVKGRDGDDNLDVNDCTFHGDFTVDMGGDDDHVILDELNFDKSVKISGGGGDGDNASVRSGNNFRRRLRLRHFES